MKTKIKDFFQKMEGDKVIWILLIFLSLCSMVLIYSAASNDLLGPTERHNLMPYISSHGFYLLLGWLVAFVVQYVDYRKVAPYSRLCLLVAFIILLCTLFVGHPSEDVRRSISIFGHQIQTFYIVVLLVIVFMANELAHMGERINDLKHGYFPFLAILFVFALLLMTQNVSTSLILLFVAFTLLFISDLKKSTWFITVGIGLSVVVILVATSGFHLGALSRFETVHARVERFFNAPGDTKTYVESLSEADIDNIRQDIHMEGAVSTGGIFPVNGPGNSIYSSMPQSYTDCIFSIAVEEYGALFGALLLFCYMVLMYRVLLIVRRLSDAFGIYLACGIGVWITFQALLHISVCVGVAPNTGQALPLVSWGNVSILTTCTALGLLLNISKAKSKKKHTYQKEENHE